METVLLILLLLSFLAAFAAAFRHYLHMFQLNSYKPNVQLKWLRTNLRKGVVPRAIGVVIAVPLLFFCGTVGMILSTLLFIVLMLANRPRTAKLPLVYTNRIKRMIVTASVLLAAVLVVSFLFCTQMILTAVLLPVVFLLSPLLVLLSNLINRPIEQAINRWYINDARKMIAAMPSLTVIGITGSYGKTSTKFFLQKLLSAKYNVLMTPESYNTTLGVVKTIRTQLRATYDIFLCEMGARNIGDIKEICDIVHPKCGLITSIGPQHLESFHSVDNVIRTKFELADAVPENGMVFLNADNAYIQNKKIDKTAVFYGIENTQSDYYASHVTVSSKGSTFIVHTKEGQQQPFSTKLIGTHNVSNIVGAIAVAHTLGVPLTDLVQQVRRLESVPHRLQLIRGDHALIIDDAYNSNPSGAKAALETLSAFDGFKILVTPGMVELGAKEDECNHAFGTQAAGVCDFVVLVGEKQTKSIFEGLLSKGYAHEKIYVAANLKDGLEHVNAMNTGNVQKIVLLENDLPDNY